MNQSKINCFKFKSNLNILNMSLSLLKSGPRVSQHGKRRPHPTDNDLPGLSANNGAQLRHSGTSQQAEASARLLRRDEMGVHKLDTAHLESLSERRLPHLQERLKRAHRHHTHRLQRLRVGARQSILYIPGGSATTQQQQ